jgi:hypothetical protein
MIQGPNHDQQAGGVSSSLRLAGENSVILEFNNHSTERRYLLTWNAPMVGTLDNDVFEFQGVRARYIGRLVKRLPPRAEDLIPVEPGQTLTSEPIDLSTFYRTDPGAASPVVRYRAYHATDMEGEFPNPLVSDWIELSGSLPPARFG